MGLGKTNGAAVLGGKGLGRGGRKVKGLGMSLDAGKQKYRGMYMGKLGSAMGASAVLGGARGRMSAAAAGVVNPMSKLIYNEPEELQFKTERRQQKQTLGFKVSLGGQKVDMSSTMAMDSGTMTTPTNGDFPSSPAGMGGNGATPAGAFGAGGGMGAMPAMPAPQRFPGMLQQCEMLMRNEQPQYIYNEPEELQFETERRQQKQTLGFKVSLGGQKVDMSSTMAMDSGTMTT